ncbi:MAG: deoxyribodipyrimidine photo-lyase [Rhodobacteraceae bacterium]|nr:deoxyribodipyrimidine photo-lyase [Paracoccaceae bacterium]
MTTLVWFRQDLRVADNPALFEAAKLGPVVPVFVYEDASETGNVHPLGGASQWWLHHSLEALEKTLGSLVLLRGDARHVIPDLARTVGAGAVFWNRCYDGHAIERDTQIKSDLRDMELEVKSFNSALLFEPWEVRTKNGGPFKVYSPFWNAVKDRDIDPPLPAPEKLRIKDCSEGQTLADLKLLPENPDWAQGWNELWSVGEKGAQQRLHEFLKNDLEDYKTLRDRPDCPNVSRLSPHLHFGEISSRQIWRQVQDEMAATPEVSKDGWKFLSEIVWREFSHHILYEFPELPWRNWRSSFDAYPWSANETYLTAWQKGQTGYPIVDAGMRELWQTGYMHNRVRMIVASFLIKHLGISWKEGEAWFRDTLVDADLANNSASWQWVAGSGADAAPFFRIFNPMIQGAKFDPNGDYVRKWVPELKDLETKYLHAPFDAPAEKLEAAAIDLGRTYPSPIVDHATARKDALDGYEAVKAASNTRQSDG